MDTPKEQPTTARPGIDHPEGLRAHEAETRLKSFGYNELPSGHHRSPFRMLLALLKEPMLILLLCASSLYLFLGDIQEGITLLVGVVGVIALAYQQERKTENTLEKLRTLSSPRVRVRREGRDVVIPGRELVPDDVFYLNEGERVPADAIVIESANVLVDESALTGESVPVRKKAWGQTQERTNMPGGEDKPEVWSGTMVVRGHGLALVTATGVSSALGKIGRSIENIRPEDTLLHRDIRKITRTVAMIAVSLCIIVVLTYGLGYSDWMKGVLSGLTLAMALLPEEFPIVLTIFLTLGAWRLARQNLLARKAAVIETLGAATVLCTDKTGTLTMNQMQLELLLPSDAVKDEAELVHTAYFASAKGGFDPMDLAIIQKLESSGYRADPSLKIVREYPLESGFPVVIQVREQVNGSLVVSAKGAPEAILRLCRLADEETSNLQKQVHKMATRGMRILAVAGGNWPAQVPLPDDRTKFSLDYKGLLGFADPVREHVPAAVGECHRAGVKVVMITGDYPETARQIGLKIGFPENTHMMTGPEIDEIPDSNEGKERIRRIRIFSRVTPVQKLRIVEAFKAGGEVVAMTGDGVNDAPALKAAHIGIAMGGRGTDVAREAASLVLLDDDFSTIVDGIRQGRHIYANLRKAMAYILAIHIPIAGLSCIPVFSPDFPVIFWPAHIAFLELVIDPVCSVAFEGQPAEPGIMSRPPRSTAERLFPRRNLLTSLAQGVSALIACLASYLMCVTLDFPVEDTRTIVFSTLMFANLSLILVNQSWEQTVFATPVLKNRALLGIAGVTALIFLLMLYVPFFQSIFHFSTLRWEDLLISAGCGISCLTWFEIGKILKRMKAEPIGKAA